MSLILIDKPEGPTSHAVVATLKRALGAEKVGHLGTLDPFASGLLPVMIGNTARLSDEAMDGRKGYLFTIGFGRETDTLDPTGRVVAEAELPQLSDKSLTAILENFSGSIEQIPPVYSALKMNGMPLYEYMRASGKLPVDIATKKRTVMIHSLEVVEFTGESMKLRVVCSKGTYVRSLARDIAKTLGTVGTCIQLRREMVEPWQVADALPLHIDSNSGRISAPAKDQLLERLLPAWSVAPLLPRVRIAETLESRLLSGNPLLLSADEMIYESGNPYSQSSETKIDAPAGKLFTGCGTTLFLSEAQRLPDGMWKIQPRKRIQ